jgi:hypothetical protein
VVGRSGRRDVSMRGEQAGEGVAGWDEVVGGADPPGWRVASVTMTNEVVASAPGRSVVLPNVRISS